MTSTREQLGIAENVSLPQTVCRLDIRLAEQAEVGLQQTVVTEVGLVSPDIDMEAVRRHLRKEGTAGVALTPGGVSRHTIEHREEWGELLERSTRLSDACLTMRGALLLGGEQPLAFQAVAKNI